MKAHIKVTLSIMPLHSNSYHDVTLHITIPHNTTPHNVTPHNAIPHNAIPHNATQHSNISCNATQHNDGLIKLYIMSSTASMMTLFMTTHSTLILSIMPHSLNKVSIMARSIMTISRVETHNIMITSSVNEYRITTFSIMTLHLRSQNNETQHYIPVLKHKSLNVYKRETWHCNKMFQFSVTRLNVVMTKAVAPRANQPKF
jgi:hypothetical protein